MPYKDQLGNLECAYFAFAVLAPHQRLLDSPPAMARTRRLPSVQLLQSWCTAKRRMQLRLSCWLQGF